MTKLTASLYVFLLTVVFSQGAQAADPWHIQLSPYVWLAGFKGEVSPIKGLPPSQVDISVSDAIADTESSFMVIIDAKKGKHGIFTDIFYSNVDSDDQIDPVSNASIQSTTKSSMLTIGYQRQVFSNNDTTIDLLSGSRWWHIDAKLKLRLPPSLYISNSSTESWFDPFIGVKGYTAFNDSAFFLTGGIGYGGFGINADSFYDVSVNMGYQLTNTIATVFGYRQYELDYDDNGFKYDVKQSGWQLGLTWGV